MKARFIEILQDYCNLFEFDITQINNTRGQPRPEIKAMTIQHYKEEYPLTGYRQMGEWLDCDHSTIRYYHIEYNLGKQIPEQYVKKYSSFVSFGYPKVRFTHKYV